MTSFLHHLEADAAQDVDRLGRVSVTNRTALCPGLRHRDGPDVDALDAQALADVHQGAGRFSRVIEICLIAMLYS